MLVGRKVRLTEFVGNRKRDVGDSFLRSFLHSFLLLSLARRAMCAFFIICLPVVRLLSSAVSAFACFFSFLVCQDTRTKERKRKREREKKERRKEKAGCLVPP